MKLDVLVFVFMGYFVEVSQSGGGHHGKHVHIKIIVPIKKHTHKHTHTIYKKPKEEKKFIIHKHHHGHGHDHKHHYHHGHNKHKDKYHKHDDWHKPWNVETFKPSPPSEDYRTLPHINEIYDDDGYLNSHKSFKTESFHITEAKNSEASDPISKYYLTGNYKLLQTDPEDVSKYHKVFQAPFANINIQESNYEPSAPAEEEGGVEYYEDEVQNEPEDYDYNGEVELTTPFPENGLEALKQFFHSQ